MGRSVDVSHEFPTIVPPAPPGEHSDGERLSGIEPLAAPHVQVEEGNLVEGLPTVWQRHFQFRIIGIMQWAEDKMGPEGMYHDGAFLLVNDPRHLKVRYSEPLNIGEHEVGQRTYNFSIFKSEGNPVMDFSFDDAVHKEFKCKGVFREVENIPPKPWRAVFWELEKIPSNN